MSNKLIKIPGPDRQITIEHNARRVIVRLGGKVIADAAMPLLTQGELPCRPVHPPQGR